MRRSLLREFLQLEAAGGFLLLGAAVLALILANSSLEWLYDGLLETAVVVQVGALKLAKPLLLWINDGLMAVFFLLVGLEIKREVAEGELSSWHRAALPVAAAIGGIAVPAAIYFLINAGSPATMRGWAIPTATDIAFALGVLTLLGARAPAALKIFLLALAIIDDFGAIITGQQEPRRRFICARRFLLGIRSRLLRHEQQGIEKSRAARADCSGRPTVVELLHGHEGIIRVRRQSMMLFAWRWASGPARWSMSVPSGFVPLGVDAERFNAMCGVAVSQRRPGSS
jgi:hypothetical protein